MSYCPKPFIEERVPVLHNLIESHSLGTWTSWSQNQLMVNHIPFFLDPSVGKNGALVGHVARVNPIWKALAQPTPSVVVFQGAQTYITPNFYASKKEHGKVVPTWNYMVVHAHGMPRAIDDKEWLLNHLNQLSDKHETGREDPWQVSDAPANFIDKMINGIVGVELPIETLEGRWKLSQNKNAADHGGVVDGLAGSAEVGDQLMSIQVAEASN